MNTRPVSITHLVFGLIALGIAAIWVVGETTDAEAPALAIWGPVVLIAAGAVGLAATVFNGRRSNDTPRVPAEPATTEPEHADSGVIHEENQQ
jgi:hypothetical protein